MKKEGKSRFIDESNESELGETNESKHRSIHHIVPTSRGGPKEKWNEYRWSIKRHRAWHIFTHNYLPSEVIILIRESWTLPNGQLDIEKMGERFYRAWQKAFEDWTPQEAIRHIEERFLPVEIQFLNLKKEGTN